ncbi:unnamed protein product [Rhodiola kirilowii]
MAGSPSFPRNRYWILRHGKSIPNDIGVIVSSMENGTLEKYQLCPEGVDQAKAAGELFLKELKENNIPIENVRICYSPFSRTTQTAKIVASVLNISLEGPQGKVIEDLKERYFGPTFELGSHEKYPEIWDLDAKDPSSRPEGGESVFDVVYRLSIALETIESEFQGKGNCLSVSYFSKAPYQQMTDSLLCAILMVSHGDPLQILQTVFNAIKHQSGFENIDIASSIEAVKTTSVLAQHRNFGLDTAELRRLV